MSASPTIRYLPLARPHAYAVWLGDRLLGEVERWERRSRGRHNWLPTLPDGTMLATQRSRQEAVAALLDPEAHADPEAPKVVKVVDDDLPF